MISQHAIRQVLACSRNAQLNWIVKRFALDTNVCYITLSFFIYLFRNLYLSMHRFSSVQAAVKNESVMSPTEVDPKIRGIIDQISKLTLLEVAELNQALKTTLNIPDAPVMAFSAGAAPAAAPKSEVCEDFSIRFYY